ncbi:MAG: ABC transporter substrate-binding protein [Candidatus Thiodiazotropha sp.]|jgi:multiple sugar transport system substrate-binding protein
MGKIKWFSLSLFILTTFVCQAVAGTTLTFWHGIESPDSILVLNEKMTLFKEKTGIEVKLVHYGSADQVNGKIMTAVAGNKAPDIMWWGPMNTGQMAKTGKLVKIDDLLKNDSSFDKSDIYPGLWEGGSYQGAVWTFPFSANNVALYYNKDHFQAAGLDPNGLNTWEDLKTYAKKLTTKNRYGLELSIGKGEWLTFSTLLPFLWQAGGELVTSDGGKAVFNSQAGVEALEYLSDFVNKDKSAKWSEVGAGYKIDNFVAGRVSMMICGPWNLNALQSQDNVKFGAIFLPKGKVQATDLGGENLYMFKSNEAQEKAAWELFKFIASSDFQVDWAMQTGYLPISKSAANDQKYKSFLENNPFIKTFSDQMQYAKARPGIPAYQKVSDAFSKAADYVFYEKKSAKQALDDAAVKATKYLK